MDERLVGKRIGFIGGGNMAEALIKGIVSSGSVTPDNILVHDVAAERGEYLERTYGVHLAKDNLRVAARSDVVVLAVKPQVLAPALDRFAEHVGARLVCSIVAGASIARLRTLVGESARVVRVMPNTPALALEGIAALCGGPGASEVDLGVAEALFGAVGQVLRVANEGLMDAVTGLSGSGPAFVLMFLEALSDAGVRAGLGRAQANLLAAQTVLGTAKMALESAQGFAALREMVTSPAGTTIAGCQALEDRAFRGAVMAAVEAAVARSRELGG